MTNNLNPWKNMPASTQRRVQSNGAHNLFWITDLEGKYGLHLQANSLFDQLEIPAKLKGIFLLKKNSSTHGELFLVLSNKEDWQIFHTLCEDLISTTYKYENDVAMINAVEVRLKRWQQLLQHDNNREMTLERQMGLFTELLCLRDIIVPKFGMRTAINSWVGADFDKQDFLLDNLAIEVKSHKTSKGAKVTISSLEQLYSNKASLFLISYSLTTSKNGLAINSIIKDIKKILEKESNEIYTIFDNKLIEYGFIPELMNTQQNSFIVDKINVFHVLEDFPRITPRNVKEQIVTVQYTIDLNYCSDYEIALDNIFHGGEK